MIIRISSNLIPFFLVWTVISIFCAISHAQTASDANASGAPDLVYPARPLVFSCGGNKEGLPELEKLEKLFVDVGSSSIPLANKIVLDTALSDMVELKLQQYFKIDDR
jgi:hypothetical protein